MIFVDTNVIMYAVGRPHPLRQDARTFFEQAQQPGAARLCTSAEVLQELLHAYLPVGRMATLDAALELVARAIREVWPVASDDVLLARALVDDHPGLGARDLLYLACCQRRRCAQLKTYERALSAAFAG